MGETRAWNWRFGRRGCSHSRDLVNEKVKVSLPGGKLRIHWSGLATDYHGERHLVYTGEVDLKVSQCRFDHAILNLSMRKFLGH